MRSRARLLLMIGLWSSCARSEQGSGLVTAVSAEDVPDLVVAQKLLVDTREPALVEVTCTSPDLPDDVHHRVDEVAPADDALTGLVSVSLFGLRADTRYDCTVRAVDDDEASAVELSFETQPLPDEMPPVDIVVPASDRSLPGYTLFDMYDGSVDGFGRKLVLIDPKGEIRWYRDLPTVPDAKVDVDVSYLGDGMVLYGGALAYDPAVIDLSGEVVYEAPPPVGELGCHHHVELLPDGRILSLSETAAGDGDDAYRAIAVEAREVGTGLVGFSWTSHGAVASGVLPRGAGADPFHPNSVSLVDDDDGPAAMISLRHMNRIVRVDRETGEITWTLGPDGDFTLLDEAGNVVDDEAEWFYGQHDPEWDWPYVLLHDNGWNRPGGVSYSRGLELKLDVAARTAQVVWRYSEDGWYERFFGDADRLSNGNVLLSQGHALSSPSDRRSSITEVDPVTNDVVWRAVFPREGSANYRAERIDGCAIFANERWCAPERRELERRDPGLVGEDTARAVLRRP